VANAADSNRDTIEEITVPETPRSGCTNKQKSKGPGNFPGPMRW
jgi:hypothetical protein